MISGIGTDIVAIDRIARVIARHGDAFLEHVYTPEERAAAASRNDRTSYFAGRWAAKEALSKALGCGIGVNCTWQDITVRNGNKGKPEMELSGAAGLTAGKLGIKHVHLSLSHEKNLASATVILEI